MIEGFDHPAGLVAVPVALLAVAAMRWLLRRPANSVGLPSTELFMELPHTVRERCRHLPAVLRLAALVLVLVSLCGPFVTRDREFQRADGLDILLAIDVSWSMTAEDFEPNRLGAARRAAVRLVGSRPQDRFGLVTFASDVQMNSPLTRDHAAVLSSLQQVSAVNRAGGTALGDAIGHGVNALRHSTGPRRILLVFTDGASNAGELDAVTVAATAARFGIRLHTVAIGSDRPAPFPTEFGRISMPIPQDASLLSRIVAAGGGRLILVSDARGFDRLTEDMDRLEPRRMVVERKRTAVSLTYPLAALAALCAFADLALAATVFQRVP